MQGQTSDMEISLKLIMSLRKELYEILSNHTGKSVKEVEKNADRDYWMTATEAKDYGLIDEVLIKK
jgi:ATP-dependent Clp protease protease subunit